MRETIDWIAAEADRVEDSGVVRRRGRFAHEDIPELTTEGTLRLRSKQAEGPGGSASSSTWTGARGQDARATARQDAGATEEGQNPDSVADGATRVGYPETENSNPVDRAATPELSWEEERERRINRGRTVAMLRRYMRYSIETGRLPSLLGREFFRAKVTSYIVVTFEDRVIFVHDMETCLNKLDEFSRQIIARHILQEHDQEATARLLHCTGRAVRTYVPIALDLMAEILLDVGLLERIVPIREKSCQGGKTGKNFVSGCEESKNKF